MTVVDQIPTHMTAVQLVGHGGIEMLHYREDVPTPSPGPGEVLIKGGAGGLDEVDVADATWSGVPMAFPRIQGADCCGRIVAVGEGVDTARTGERVIVRTLMRSYVDNRPFESSVFGSEYDGGFAQFVRILAKEAYPVSCGLTDTELASIPCAFSTAENMLHRVSVGAERVLVTGASGGVGTAAIQLAKRRGAYVIAVASGSKADAVRKIGADEVVDRNADLVKGIGSESVDVVVDLVVGGAWSSLLDVLKRGGRYTAAGAIAGPIVEFDARTLYLKDLSFFGCRFQEDEVFVNLISYIERGEIRPVVARTYPLADIAEAQNDFLAKRYTGKLVLIPPRVML